MTEFVATLADLAIWFAAAVVMLAREWHLWYLAFVVALVGAMGFGYLRPKRVTIANFAIAAILFALMVTAIQRCSSAIAAEGLMRPDQVQRWNEIPAILTAFFMIIVAYMAPLWVKWTVAFWRDPWGKASLTALLLLIWIWLTPMTVNGLLVLAVIVAFCMMFEQMVNRGGAR